MNHLLQVVRYHFVISINHTLRLIHTYFEHCNLLPCLNNYNKNLCDFIRLGGDDGFLHVWDLRQFQTKTPVATFKHHTEPVTTVEWHPTEATVFASGGADNQIALWDLSVEKDTEESTEDIKVNYLHILIVPHVVLS